MSSYLSTQKPATPNNNATIIGAGISGLATAIALQKNGISVTVYEASKEITAVGAGIILPPNAIQILKRYDLAQQIITAGNPLSKFVVLTPQGKTLSSVPAVFNIDKNQFQAIAIQRSSLQDILLNTLPDNSIKTNKTCVSITTQNNKNELGFQDGSTSHCDYVIAADGLNSAIGNSIFPNRKLRYSGQTCWRGTSNFNLPKNKLSQFTEVWGNGTIFGFVAVSPTQVYWFISTKSAATQEHNQNQTILNLIEQFSAHHPLLTELILNTKQDDIIHNDLYDLAPLDSWFKYSVVLTGDAAHATMPNLGQGGAQAIEDSFVLAQELSGNNDLTQAFSQYQQRRQTRVNNIVRNSLIQSKIAHLSSKSLCIIRNFLMQNTPAFITKQQVKFLFKA